MRATSGPPTRGPEPGRSQDERVRLQRVLAAAGFGSRRHAEDLIRDGRVRIGSRVAELGDRVDPARDVVTVDGVPVPTHPELAYWMLNKPVGATSTLRDPHATSTLSAFLPAGPRVFPVGRLDRDSEGLLLFTNDGELANRLQHPRYGVEREYLVEVEGALPRSAAARLLRGVVLEDGPARAVRVGQIRRASGRSAVSVVMVEGRKRVVRRMFQVVGFPVRRLIRTRLGDVRLGRLSPGATRRLEPEEVASLYRAANLDRASPGDRHRIAARAATEPRGEGTGRHPQR